MVASAHSKQENRKLARSPSVCQRRSRKNSVLPPLTLDDGRGDGRWTAAMMGEWNSSEQGGPRIGTPPPLTLSHFARQWRARFPFPPPLASTISQVVFGSPRRAYAYVRFLGNSAYADDGSLALAAAYATAGAPRQHHQHGEEEHGRFFFLLLHQ